MANDEQQRTPRGQSAKRDAGRGDAAEHGNEQPAAAGNSTANDQPAQDAKLDDSSGQAQPATPQDRMSQIQPDAQAQQVATELANAQAEIAKLKAQIAEREAAAGVTAFESSDASIPDHMVPTPWGQMAGAHTILPRPSLVAELPDPAQSEGFGQGGDPELRAALQAVQNISQPIDAFQPATTPGMPGPLTAADIAALQALEARQHREDQLQTLDDAMREASRTAAFENERTRQLVGARVGVEAMTLGLDTTQPGGRYLVGGRFVDAHGRELNSDGSLKNPYETIPQF